MIAAAWWVTCGHPPGHRPSPVLQASPTHCSGATPWPRSRWSPSSRCHTTRNLLFPGHPGPGLSPLGPVPLGSTGRAGGAVSSLGIGSLEKVPWVTLIRESGGVGCQTCGRAPHHRPLSGPSAGDRDAVPARRPGTHHHPCVRGEEVRGAGPRQGGDQRRRVRGARGGGAGAALAVGLTVPVPAGARGCTGCRRRAR